MIYTTVIILTIISLAILSIFAEKKQEKRRTFCIINFTLFALGVVFLICSYCIGQSKINSYSADIEYFSWANDFFNLYYDLSMLPFVILFAINLAASVISIFDPRQARPVPRILRKVVSLASSLLMLILPYYGLFTQNENIPLYIYIMISGIGQALIMRCSDAVTLIHSNNNYERANK